ncbi:MAG: hypothetical protein Q9164_003706 [Protoblastenia rupestris]
MSTQGPNAPGGGQLCNNSEGAGPQLLCLISKPFAQTFKATSIWTALGTSLGFMIIITLAFSLLRPFNSVVYAPKMKYADEKHAPPVIGKGFLDWMSPVAKVHEAEMVEKIGLDATVFLRFTKMLRNMFAVMTIAAIGIVLPTNLITGGKSKEAEAFKAKGFWTISTPRYTEGNPLWAHVIGAWLVNIVVVFFLWRNYVAITRLRRGYFEDPEYLHSLHSRTLMFTDIPPGRRTDEGILRLADEVEQTAGIPRAAIGRNVKDLPDLIEQHEQAVRALESVLAKYLKNPDKLPANRPTLRPSKNYRKNNGGGKVDAIDYLTDRIAELELEIKHVRESVDKRNPMPYGFASFEKIEEAHTVAYAAKGKHPQGTTIRLAPKPNDIIWQNLPLTKKDRGWKRFINNLWIALLTVVWIAPNALIAVFLSNLSNLANVWNAFKVTYEDSPKGWAIVQGIASPALTSLIYLLLPIAFRRLSIHAGDTTKTSRERHVTTKLFAFFVFNNLIIFSAFSAVWAYITNIIDNRNDKNQSVWEAIQDGYFFYTLRAGLIEVAPFWLTWLLQRNLGSAADLAQMIQLTWVWFGKTFTSPTPRQAIELTAPCPFDYAVYYNYFLFYATVALCFTTLQPLVIPITAFYFAIDYWLKKYLLLYVLITKTESGGQFWRILFNRLIFATILADVMIATVIKAAGSWAMIATMAPLPILLIAFKIYCARTFDDQNEFYTKATLKDPENMADPGKKLRRNDRVASKFGHPALYAKLMTPMVHAKAQHVLSTIYRGRLNQEGSIAHGTTMDYSDTIIAMDPMSQTHPGKTAHFAPSQGPHKIKRKELFELVPSNKLDFAFYKSRPEFADENGGDGELYGRPTDLISERSGTPHSFMGRGSGANSPSSSRASSPGAGERYRTVSPQQLQNIHPAYRDGGGVSDGSGWRRHMYRSSDNESETNLLRAAQPVGVDEWQGREGDAGKEVYGLDQWRRGGSGYVGVPGGEAHGEQGMGMGYEAYRGGAGR